MADARFRRTSGGVSSLGRHVVWCPKYRRAVLDGRVARRLDERLDDIASEHDWEIVAREVPPDHVRDFVRVRPTDAPSEVARAFEGRTSRVLGQELPTLARSRVLWSKSYFVASVRYVSEATVRRYIEHRWDEVA